MTTIPFDSSPLCWHIRPPGAAAAPRRQQAPQSSTSTQNHRRPPRHRKVVHGFVRCAGLHDPAPARPQHVQGPLAGHRPRQVPVLHHPGTGRQLPRRPHPRRTPRPGLRPGHRPARILGHTGTGDHDLVPARPGLRGHEMAATGPAFTPAWPTHWPPSLPCSPPPPPPAGRPPAPCAPPCTSTPSAPSSGNPAHPIQPPTAP